MVLLTVALFRHDYTSLDLFCDNDNYVLWYTCCGNAVSGICDFKSEIIFDGRGGANIYGMVIADDNCNYMRQSYSEGCVYGNYMIYDHCSSGVGRLFTEVIMVSMINAVRSSAKKTDLLYCFGGDEDYNGVPISVLKFYSR